MTEWNYDGSFYRFPMRPGELWTCSLGKVMVHDLYGGLPAHMCDADCVFVDPPWNAGNENSFRTKAGVAHNRAGFDRFMGMIFDRLDEIAPRTLFYEIGKQNLRAVEKAIDRRFPITQTFDATYGGRHPCYVVRGAYTPAPVDYGGLDQMDIIEKLCAVEPFTIIADPCMGLGAVGLRAWERRRQFRGTELNPKRLSSLVNLIHQGGGCWYRDGVMFRPDPNAPAPLRQSSWPYPRPHA